MQLHLQLLELLQRALVLLDVVEQLERDGVAVLGMDLDELWPLLVLPIGFHDVALLLAHVQLDLATSSWTPR